MDGQQPGASARHERALASAVRRPRGPSAGLLSVRDWLVTVARRRPALADALLAAVIIAISLPPFTSLLANGHERAVALTVAMVIPLAWRRKAPLAVLLIMTVPAVAQVYTAQQITDFLAFLVAYYTVAACSPPLRFVAGTVVIAAGTVLAVLHLESPVSHSVQIMTLAGCLLAAAGLLGYYVRTTRQERVTAQADRAEQAEREREHQAELAAAAERARIAREMHDIVAHNLAVMIALADGAAYTAADDTAQAITLMGQVSATGRTALTEMRRLLGVLRRPAAAGNAPQPGLAELDGLLTAVRSAGLTAELTTSGQRFPLPPSAELAVYRITGEALTNTLKHAPGATARVHLACQPGSITLEITDDGGPGRGAGAVASAPLAGVVTAGVAPARPDQDAATTGHPDQHPATTSHPDQGTAQSTGTGHGIAGMLERAAMFGGALSAGPMPDGGWLVHATLRIDQARDQAAEDL